eukprot:GHVT01024034.1.p1 GENE.GHVT01024034.1~~GHVT01024034.1.p1  ORF type:complete len:274 (+),score=2.69 GHVT01024034.1:304-1125(+)
MSTPHARVKITDLQAKYNVQINLGQASGFFIFTRPFTVSKYLLIRQLSFVFYGYPTHIAPTSSGAPQSAIGAMPSTGAFPRRISSLPLAKQHIRNAGSSRSFIKRPIAVVGSLAFSVLLGVCCLLVFRCMRTARMKAAEDRASSQSISVKPDNPMPRAVGNECVLLGNNRNFETGLINLSTPQPLDFKLKGVPQSKALCVCTYESKKHVYAWACTMCVIDFLLGGTGLVFLVSHICYTTPAFSAATAALLVFTFFTMLPSIYIGWPQWQERKD